MCLNKIPAEVAKETDKKPFGSLTREMSQTNRKALEHFSAAIELDSEYLKPYY
jgi:hypothetical protein